MQRVECAGTMQVTYENTRADTFALYLYLTPKQREFRIMAAVFLLGILVINLRIPLHPLSFLGYTILALFGFVIWLVVWPVITIATIILSAALSRNKGFLCQHWV